MRRHVDVPADDERRSIRTDGAGERQVERDVWPIRRRIWRVTRSRSIVSCLKVVSRHGRNGACQSDEDCDDVERLRARHAYHRPTPRGQTILEGQAPFGYLYIRKELTGHPLGVGPLVGLGASMPPNAAKVDSVRLEASLKVLAYANRLDLLAMLREPHTLEEIRLEPGPAKAGERPERPISRQAVAYHLQQLVEAGLIRSAPTQREGKKTLNEFSVEQANLYALVEDFRRLSTLGATKKQPLTETVGMEANALEPWNPGAKIVLVHGVYEGKAYPLNQATAKPPRGWVIGRRASSHVCLSYDPYVSNENAEVLQRRDGMHLLDLRSSRNGTFLNWERIKPGEEVPLAAGDIIGVGRSLLVYKER